MWGPEMMGVSGGYRLMGYGGGMGGMLGNGGSGTGGGKSQVPSLIQCTRKKHLSRLMTKTTKWHVRPAKTQISLGVRPV